MPFGACQRFNITSIGAERVAVRQFTPSTGPTAGPSAASAGELVAVFPDALTARRAFAVLIAWHDQCAPRLRGDDPKARVGALQTVSVSGGARAQWYLLNYRLVGSARRDAQGMVVLGKRIAMLKTQRPGGTTSTAGEPMPTALSRAAALLS